MGPPATKPDGPLGPGLGPGPEIGIGIGGLAFRLGNIMNRTTRQYPHELFEELDAVAPRWQQQYGSLQEAALTLGLDQLLLEYLRTEQGQAYLDRMDGVPDTLERNAQERAYREKLLRKLK